MAAHPRGTYADAMRAPRLAQKASRNAPAYSRWVNRPLGRRIAAPAYVAGITPDQVTGISACLTFAGIAGRRHEPGLPGRGRRVLLVMGYAFDSADGQLARLRGGGTPRGEWLDHVMDSAKNAAVHLAVLVAGTGSAARELFGVEGDALLLIPLAYAGSWSTVSLLRHVARPTSCAGSTADRPTRRTPRRSPPRRPSSAR